MKQKPNLPNLFSRVQYQPSKPDKLVQVGESVAMSKVELEIFKQNPKNITLENLESLNPILPFGGYVVTGKNPSILKIGNGVDAWNNLKEYKSGSN